VASSWIACDQAVVDGIGSSWAASTASEIGGVAKGNEIVVVFQIGELLHNWKLRSWTPGEEIESKELKSYVPAISYPKRGIVVIERVWKESFDRIVE
jgi:hypothetical protein